MYQLDALRAFIVKEMRHILRDRQTLAVLLLMPLVQVVLFGYAMRTDVRDVRIAFVDPAPDHATIALRNRFGATDRFHTVAVVPSTAQIRPLFRSGKVDVALLLQPGFASALESGQHAQAMIIIDATDPNSGSQRGAYVAAVIQDYQEQLGGPVAVRQGLAILPPPQVVVARVSDTTADGAVVTAQGGPVAPARVQQVAIVPQLRMRYNPTLESVNLFVPGLIALVLTMVCALMTAISLSREKERGTLEVLLVSPLRPWEIITGKVAPYLVLALANVVTALVVAWALFRVPLRGSIVLLLAASMLYAMVSLAIGVLIAAVTPSQRAAMLGALLATMLPSTILSGLVFPIASMPVALQVVTHVVPARWFIVVTRGIMLKGAGLAELWLELGVLALMLAVLMLLALRAFKPRLA